MFLDSTGTTKPTELAINSFVNINQDNWRNPSATMSEAGIEARRVIERSRNIVMYEIGAEKPDQIIFTSGSTEGANMIIKGFIPRGQEKNYGIICSAIEHPAVWETCQYMSRCGVDVKTLWVDDHGHVNIEELYYYLDKMKYDGILVCVMDSNNETGVVQNTNKIADIVHEYPGAYLFSDMTQSFAHADVFKVGDLKYDFAIGSAQKFGGLKGVGFVYARDPQVLTPLIHGGGQENGYRSGTENVGGIYSMALQFDQICSARDHGDFDYLRKLRNTLIDMLEENFPDCKILSEADGLPSIVNVLFPGRDANSIVSLLELNDIQVSAGSACHTGVNEPSRVLTSIGLSADDARSVIRISLDTNISAFELKTFISALREVMF